MFPLRTQFIVSAKPFAFLERKSLDPSSREPGRRRSVRVARTVDGCFEI